MGIRWRGLEAEGPGPAEPAPPLVGGAGDDPPARCRRETVRSPAERKNARTPAAGRYGRRSPSTDAARAATDPQ
jgi:hypothetical protein